MAVCFETGRCALHLFPNEMLSITSRQLGQITHIEIHSEKVLPWRDDINKVWKHSYRILLNHYTVWASFKNTSSSMTELNNRLFSCSWLQDEPRDSFKIPLALTSTAGSAGFEHVGCSAWRRHVALLKERGGIMEGIIKTAWRTGTAWRSSKWTWRHPPHGSSPQHDQNLWSFSKARSSPGESLQRLGAQGRGKMREVIACFEPWKPALWWDPGVTPPSALGTGATDRCEVWIMIVMTITISARRGRLTSHQDKHDYQSEASPQLYKLFFIMLWRNQ